MPSKKKSPGSPRKRRSKAKRTSNMRFLHTADVHIGALLGVKRPYDSKVARYEAICSRICTTARAQKTKYVALAGDMFQHQTVKPKERDVLLRMLTGNADLTFFLIPGNHDVLEEGGYTSLHFLTILQETKRIPNLHFAEVEPRVVSVPEGHFLLLPFTDDYGSYESKVDDLLKSTPKDGKPVVLVTHQCIKGVSYETGRVARSGVVLPKRDRITYYALGDIHKRQSIKGLPNAWYPGTPAQTKFSEATKKGCLIVDTNSPTKPVFVPIEHKSIRKLVTVSGISEVKKHPKAWIRLMAGAEGSEAYDPDAAGVENVVKVTSVKTSGKSEIPKAITEIRGWKEAPLTGLTVWLQRSESMSKKEAKRCFALAEKLQRNA